MFHLEASSVYECTEARGYLFTTYLFVHNADAINIIILNSVKKPGGSYFDFRSEGWEFTCNFFYIVYYTMLKINCNHHCNPQTKMANAGNVWN